MCSSRHVLAPVYRLLPLLAILGCGASSHPHPSPAASTSSTPTANATLGTNGPDTRELADAIADLAHSTLARMVADGTEASLLDRVLLSDVAGDPSAALVALERYRSIVRPSDPSRGPVFHMECELHARAAQTRAASISRTRGGTFEGAFATSFRQVYARLDDLSALHASWFLSYDLASAKSDLEASLDRLRGKRTRDLGLDDARELCRRYALYALYKDITPLTKPLQDEDDARRYDIEENARIPTRDGETLSAFVVRPRRLAGRQPTVLFASIYTSRVSSQAFISAAHGYIGVTSFSRGKHGGTGAIVPYEREVDDVPTVIEWIAKQPWSDGRVGMYGGSYAGFTQWAAAKHLPPALKTIVPYVAAIPGQGLPMENNVFLSVNYGWSFYVTDGPLDDDKVYGDRPRWNALPGSWFTSGRAYREIDRVDGTPNPWLQRWLSHPSYDAYWQAMVPYGKDFAQIDIPVLTVTGYYDDGQISALRYFTEHTAQRKGAEHYLVIGPYDHLGAQRRPSAVLRGYTVDPVARIDTTYITFAWLDHVLRSGPMPSILADKVNYEVMGANVWRHAPSIERMHDEVLTLYLDAHHLSAKKPPRPGFLTQEIDLTDRTTQNNEYYPDPIVHDRLDDGRGIVFTSEPLAEPISIDGIFTGELRVSINKKDMDIGVELYERAPDGKYFSLAYYLGRASHARDMSVRHLLTPGKIETIPFERSRMVSRQLSKGSQIVVVVNVNKNAFAQVNYGTGKDVSDETIEGAGAPLMVRWYGDSFVRIPVRH